MAMQPYFRFHNLTGFDLRRKLNIQSSGGFSRGLMIQATHEQIRELFEM